MATSGTVYSAYGKDSRFYLAWEVSSQSIANNTSKIAWTFGLQVAGGDLWYSNSVKMISAYIDGGSSLGSGTYSNYTTSGKHALKSGTKTVSHDADGTASIAISLTGWLIDQGNKTGSATVTLPTIPRASSFTLSKTSVELNTAVRFTITRASTSLDHKLYYKIGSASRVLIASDVGASYNWTPAPALAAKFSTTTLGVTISVDTYSGSTLVGTASKSATLKLPPASEPSVSFSNNTLGSVVNITTNRKHTGYKHNLDYQVNGKVGGPVELDVGASYNWTLPPEIANDMPNTASATITILCNTYLGSAFDGGIFVGSSKTTMPVAVPDTAAFKPKINTATAVEATAGIAAKFGVFVQGKSTIRLAMTASGAYSSTISRYVMGVDINNSRVASFAAASGTTAPLPLSGSLTCSYTAIDSRGREVSQAISATGAVLPYTAPTVSALSVKRVNAAGENDDQGTDARVTVSAAITALNNLNNKTFTLRYKRTSDSSWTTQNITPSSGYSLSNATFTLSSLSVDSAYNIEVAVQDYFSGTVGTVTLPTAFTIIDFDKDGKGVAFGEVATANRLTIGTQMPLNIKGYGSGTQKTYLTLRDPAGTVQAILSSRGDGGGVQFSLYSGGAYSARTEVDTAGDIYQNGVKIVTCTAVYSGNWTIYEYSNKRWVGYYSQVITNASIATAWGNIYRSGEINITLPPTKYVWNGYTQASVGATGDTRPLCWAAKSWSGTFFICSGTVTAAQNYTLYVMAQGAWN